MLKLEKLPEKPVKQPTLSSMEEEIKMPEGAISREDCQEFELAQTLKKDKPQEEEVETDRTLKF